MLVYDLAEGFTPVPGSAALAVTEALLALLATGDPVKSPAAHYAEHDMRNDSHVEQLPVILPRMCTVDIYPHGNTATPVDVVLFFIPLCS